MSIALNVIQILAAIILIAVILLQTKGSGLGGVFGGDSSVFRTRRGLERTLFRFTVGWGIFFVVLSLLSVKLAAF